jgi:SpoVK/Ycf46/Vps4 family AAA+-type ATPase
MTSDATEPTDRTNDIFLFPSGTRLFALVETTQLVAKDLQHFALGGGAARSEYFVPITLNEDLFLAIRKPNRVELKQCKCTVQLPAQEECISLNHAYSRILRAYKPHLKAFTGNAFLGIFYERISTVGQQDLFSSLVTLSLLREEKVGEYEASLRFRRAVTAALNFHREQTRKGGTIPYISHVLSVTAIVQEYGSDEDEAIAALLHDAVDNGGGETVLDDIRTKFSQRIADIVASCTDTLEWPKPPWKERKDAFIRDLPSASDSARLVIAADKLHNARCILADLRKDGDELWSRFSGGKDGTLWYYRSITEILRKTGPHLLAAELDRVVAELEHTAIEDRAGSDATLDKLAAESHYQKLLSLTGLDDLKRLVESDIGMVLHNQRLRKVGIDATESTPVSLVLMGNPGTGKTKAARLLGAIYKSLGLLSQGHVVEVSRADLVGDVIGATERRTREAITKAQGGFLFIDEAYALAGKGYNDFGIEAVEVLLKAMSDMPRDFGVIVAGYPKPMKQFLASNPGLRSRFRGREVTFEDFTPAQLLAIAKATIERMQLMIADDALQYLGKRFERAYRDRDATFGNARYVKSLVHDIKAAMAQRMKGLTHEATHTDLVRVTLADVEAVFQTQSAVNLAIAIDEGALGEALRQLDALVGIPAVKQEITELVDLVRYYQLVGRDPGKLLSSHFVLTGNPGTGKTTVARIFARILRALGLLERGHLVECDRQALVAEYVGQTAVKTNALIDKSIGGVLFIDEAYALASGTQNDFGLEAVQVLLKRMEDERGRFVVVVAGYPDEMDEFLASNPGLKSRFDTFITFEDYCSSELQLIAAHHLADEGLMPDADAVRIIKNYCDHYEKLRDRHSGNARDVRKLVMKSIRNQYLRIARSGTSPADKAELSRIKPEDLSNWVIPKGASKHWIGFINQDSVVPISSTPSGSAHAAHGS